MIDPLTSLGLVANIIQLVDFGVRAAANGRDLAGKGQTADQSYLHALTSEIQSICTVLDDGKLDMEDLFQKRGTDVDKTPAMTRRDRSNAHTQLDVKRLAGQTKDVASELGLMLNGLKVSNDPLSGTTATNGGRKRKRDVGKSLIKAIWQDSDMQDLRRKLVELQQQMILHLSVMQNQASGEILQALGSLSRKMEMERAQVLLRLESQQSSILEKAKNLVGSIDQSGAFQTLSLGLRSMTDQARKVNDCIHILDTLRFDEICMREEGIAEAHGKTFEWLFTKPELGFISWLTSKDGLFWITGKPGSGKSTLMKYILQDERTLHHLREWAADRELIVSRHFFWNSGAAIQQSKLGLLRTVLYHIVRHSPDFALTHIPRRFHEARGNGIFPWTIPELSRALESCGNRSNLKANLCLFIDGLDECQDDHLELIEFVGSLAKCPGIKICISSRPWNVFTCAFDQQTDGQLTMQRLIDQDIRDFVADQMNANNLFKSIRESDEDRCDALIQSVCDKAQGVFLWVRLVVRSLLRGLSNDDSLQTLQCRLDEYPRTLDGYFRRMFDRIEEIYQKHSSRILLAALTAGKALPLCAPGCFEREISKPDYALSLPVCRPTAIRLPQVLSWSDSEESETVIVSVVEASQRYIDARCADLLERTGSTISFLHRTARDFLARPGMMELLTKQAGNDYEPHLSLSRVALARIKQPAGDNKDLGVLIHGLLRSESTMPAKSMVDFCKLIDNLDLHGNEIFQVYGREVSYFDATSDANTLVDSTRGTYSDSVHMFQVSAALIRLRGHTTGGTYVTEGADTGDEISDARILFGSSIQVERVVDGWLSDAQASGDEGASS